MYGLFGALPTLLILSNFELVLLKKIPPQDCLPGLPENEFAFGGNGYVALQNRGIKPRKLDRLKLSFKTLANEGLIYYTGTPKGHFESLELSNGKVIYLFELSPGRVQMASEKRYNDGKWHVLEISWMQENCSLVIDDSFESVARCLGRFNSLNFMSAVYFGGFKGRHGIEGITEKGLDGSIKDVQLGGTSRRLSMHSEMRNVQSGCPRRWRREADSDAGTHIYASYTGSTNVELYWNTTSCYDEFIIHGNKLEEEDDTGVPDKTVSDHLVEITELEPNTTYVFTLKGRIINQGEKLLRKINHTTMELDHPSLVVNSVSTSSLSVSWMPSDNFVVSLSGISGNVTVTNGTNYTFEDLMPGTHYMLDFVGSLNQQKAKREIVTTPNPVVVEAASSVNEINLSWTDASEVEVIYRIPGRSEKCGLKKLYGTSGKISQLSSGCIYQLDVFDVRSGRRSGNHTIFVETSAFPLENFTCSTGIAAGYINCTWSPSHQSQSSCLVYTLNFSSPQEDFRVEETRQQTRETYKLTPGERYSISILSKTMNGNTSSSLTTYATAKPGIDSNFFEKQSSSTHHTISFNYLKDSSHVIDYYVIDSYDVSLNGTSYLLNESIATAVFDSLKAGNCYFFTAFAVSQGEHSERLSSNISTDPHPPSPMGCINITNSSLVLPIHKPDGHVDCYDIKSPTTSEEVCSIGKTVFHNISSLKPYTDYDIPVNSVVKCRHNKKKSISAIFKCKTAEGIPGRIDIFENKTYLSDRLSLYWLKPVSANGEITGYYIRVGQNGKTTQTFKVDVEHTTYVLHYSDVLPGKTYNISISATTSAGEGEVHWKNFTLKDAPSDNTLFVVLAILLAVLFIVLIGLLLYYYIRNSPQRMQSFRRMSSRLRNPSDQIAMQFPEPSVTSKPIKISQFLEHIKFLEKDSGLKFSEEYEDLKYVGRNQSREEAELQCNRVKNRFTNILPYDVARVKLLPMEDEDGSDYVNASWIPGFHSKREFIASQGPLPSTVNDFWRMVWENNCQAIVMLTLCIEKGHIKCEQYWPMDKEPVFYGDLKVEIQNETKTNEWSILEFKISLGAQTRKVKHFHYTGWPDMYVPEKTSLIAFVQLVRESINTSNSKGPVVVHCSAGVGRTGTFIALDTLLLHVQEGHDLDVYGIVFQMRMNRVLMVQTEAQYVFIYECLHEVMKEPDGDIEETKEAASEDNVKTEDSTDGPSKTKSEPKPNCDSKEEPSNKTESEPKPNCDSKEEPSNKTESEPKPNCNSKEEPSNKESELNKPVNNESESKENSDSKEEPTKEESTNI